jgi:hypothetical protein
LREHASPVDRAEIDRALIAWTTADLAGRAEQGGHSTEKILSTIGAPALPRLLALVGEGGPSAERAAGIAVAAATTAEERARVGDALVDAARRSIAKSRDVSDAFLVALARFGRPGEHAKTTAYLVELAESGPPVVRDRALKALANGGAVAGDAAVLSAALRLAGDGKAPAKVREAAFLVAERVGPTAVKGLVALLDDRDEVVRWRAVEAALAGKTEAIAPVLGALSPTRSYASDDLESYVVHDLTLIGPSAVPAASQTWVARLCAIRALAKLGTAADATSLAPLAKDDTKLKDQKDLAGGTLGAEAGPRLQGKAK